MRWLIYALGGGLGHLTRSVALARTAGQRGIQCTILANSAFAHRIPVTGELNELDCLITIPPEFDRDATAARVARVLREVAFDLLIVDTFPRGLGGELAELLPSLDVPRALVHRDLSPQYVASYQLADFVQTYDCLLLPGESGPLHSHPAAVQTERWLIRDAHELLSRDDARQQLLGAVVPDDNPVVLVTGSGRDEEIDEMQQLADWLRDGLTGQAQVCFSSPTSADDQQQLSWPVFRLFAGVDVLVGAGGYNTVSEARATRTPLLAFARQRLYDRQHVRLQVTERVADREDLLTRVSNMLAAPSPPPGNMDFTNGAHQAVDVLMGLV